MSRTAADGRRALAQALRAEGELVTRALLPDADDAPDEDQHRIRGPAQVAAEGPRAAGREREYELLLEMIYEGTRLHYGEPRVFSAGDPDLCLLLGDRLYALGLARLADLGDLDAVIELADLISLLAQAQARGDAKLADAVWRAGATAIGWGSGPEHAAAKNLARAEDDTARAALENIPVPAGS